MNMVVTFMLKISQFAHDVNLHAGVTSDVNIIME